MKNTITFSKSGRGFEIILDGDYVQNPYVDGWITYQFSTEETRLWIKQNEQNLFEGDE